MNFGRVNIGGAAGFLAGAVSGPLYALSILIAGNGDVLDVDVSFGTDLIFGLPFAILFGCVLAGLPAILFGMAVGASIGDRPMTPTVALAAVATGAVVGVALLQSVNDLGLSTAVVLRGAIVGALAAYVWTLVFDGFRARTPVVIVDDPA